MNPPKNDMKAVLVMLRIMLHTERGVFVTAFLSVALVPSQTGDSKLPLGVNVCAPDALQWTSRTSRVYSQLTAKLQIHHYLDQDKALIEEE